MDLDGGKRVFHRLGPSSSTDNNSNHTNNKQQKVCYHWLQGKCTRFPCSFLHSELPTAKRAHQGFGREDNYPRGSGGLRRTPNYYSNNNNNTWGRQQSQSQSQSQSQQPPVSVNRKKIEKLCHHWIQGNCRFGDTNCKYLHQWSSGDCFLLLTSLEGHQQVVTGITLPSGSDKLYTGSQDETVKLWDCQSGQMAGLVNVGGAVGCAPALEFLVLYLSSKLISFQYLVEHSTSVLLSLPVYSSAFITLKTYLPSNDTPHRVPYDHQALQCYYDSSGPKECNAWNIQTSTELSLNGPVGQVYSLVVGSDLLFAGTQDGTILAWRFNVAANCFEPAASLTGHTLAVVTLVVGGNRIYSGSMDHSIKVWSLETLQCLQTLQGHTDVVMSVLCWDQFLLSASLDKTVKVWVATDTGNLEVTYTHTEEHGLLTLCGMHDSDAKPVLLCSSNDNTIRVYDLPSFSERGKIFSKKEVRCVQIGPGGLFFTGDGSGQVKVWKWSAEPPTTTP
ncbi:hypothetical protein RD792_005270 [Penstemon davidsonii]|uniref:C3H1-type domain-containing protein n=1 Tax=Penstemon davidsonii TaxID=160366 RepID=A0ABR0DKT9_9LAMI|nr:hypothetical protein RD792_005270 [Penstemon davidsonii]